MKKCSQCGSLNDNELLNCKECNNNLGQILSKEKEDEAILEEQKRNNQENAEDIYIHGVEVTKADKISAVVAFAGIILSIVLLIIKQNSPDKKVYLYSILCFAVSILTSISYLFFPIRDIMYKNHDLEPSDFSLFMRKIFIYIFLILGYYIIFFQESFK
ncbi:MAG: hypothetical protein A2Y15_05975 [Clostridiales bacterium GWF2_36_10]|nr:MAG: hypothetical protein A2Y15_05975 [Clostridiales bacterium GWF2_36_10]HAN21594.1 hypothetical protein [Clostridiales bacterium]